MMTRIVFKIPLTNLAFSGQSKYKKSLGPRLEVEKSYAKDRRPQASAYKTIVMKVLFPWEQMD
jgi:hypothetical protein